MPVCLQIMQALKMHKGVNELRLLIEYSNLSELCAFPA